MKLKELSENVESVYEGLDDVYEHLDGKAKEDALLLLRQLDELQDLLLEVRDDGEEEEESGE